MKNKKNIFLTIIFFCLTISSIKAISLIDFSTQFFKNYKEFSSHIKNKEQNSFSGSWATMLVKYPENIPAFIEEQELNDTHHKFAKILFEKLKENKLTKYMPYVCKINIQPNDKIISMGDIHGSAHSLFRNLIRLMLNGYLDDNLKLKSNTYMIFTGDYGSRGRYSTEVWYLLMQLAIQNPDNVFLIRGNHETEIIANRYGFSEEISNRYNTKILGQFYSIFDLLPQAIFVNNTNETIVFCHGGFPVKNKNQSSEYKIDTKMIKNILSSPYKYVNIHPSIINTSGWFNNEFEAENEIIKDSSRGGFKIGIECLNETKDIGISAIFRGHTHEKYSLSLLEEKDDEQGKTLNSIYFSHLEKTSIPNTNFTSVFTLMSCPEGCGLIFNHDGYVILKNSEKTYTDCCCLFSCLSCFEKTKLQWEITTYQFNLSDDRNEKYVHINSNNFSWEDYPMQ